MKVNTQSIRECSEGIIQSIDESITLPNSVYLAVNLVFNKTLGRAVMRDGLTQLGDQTVASKSCLGLYQFIKSDGTRVPLAVFNDALDTNSDIFKLSSGSWTITKTNLTASLKCRFLTYLDTVAVFNGTEKFASADGSSFVATGTNLDVNSMPFCRLGIEWKNKVFVAGNSSNLNRVYYSSTPTAGAISWTSGNGSIDIEPEDGMGSITGLAKVPGYLLIFKERGLKRWDGNSTYPDDLISIGCLSQEAVVQTAQSVFFYNKRGIYESVGGYPRKISRRIKDIIDAIPSTYYSSVSGWGDGENAHWSIGDITMAGLTLTNCVITYNISSKIWSLASFPSEFKFWSSYVDSNKDEFVIAGDDDGKIFEVFEGIDDAGIDISWILQYQNQEFGSRGLIKDLPKMVVYTEKVRNGKVFAKINNAGNFRAINGVIQSDVQELVSDLKGRYFSFRLQGSGKGVEIIGIDFPPININLNYNE